MSLVHQFLSNIRQFVRNQDGDQLRAWLQVEPGSPKQYSELGVELRAKCNNAQKLDKVLSLGLPQDDGVEDEQGTVWQGLISFMKDYLVYWRDADFGNLLATHQLLSGLVK